MLYRSVVMGRAKIRQYLRDNGIYRSRGVVLRTWVAGFIIICILFGLLYWCYLFWTIQPIQKGTRGDQQTTTPLKDILQTVIIIAGFVFGYIQWILARYEASLDKFYDRLTLANTQLGRMVEKAWTHTRPEDQTDFIVYKNPPGVGVSFFDMWVFAELDNLEYITKKFAWGFIGQQEALRAVDTFRSRCVHDPEFTRRASRFCASAGYLSTTQATVKNIERQLDRNTRPS